MKELITNPQVEMNKVKITGIPALEFIPSSQVERGLIFYHGWSSCKENQIFRASTLASYGMRVLVPDAEFHGERGEIDYDDEETLEKYFFPILINSCRESAGLINYLEKKLGNQSFVGVMGHSMGGFIASGVITSYDRINTMINVNGSCAWLKTRNILLEHHNSANRTPENLNIIDLGEKQIDLKRYDPYYNISQLNQRPILMLHGEEDTSVPFAAQRYFYEKAREHYDSGENINLKTYENLNHYFTTGMLEECITWMRSKS